VAIVLNGRLLDERQLQGLIAPLRQTTRRP
jgi:hypothetical protein